MYFLDNDVSTLSLHPMDGSYQVLSFDPDCFVTQESISQLDAFLHNLRALFNKHRRELSSLFFKEIRHTFILFQDLFKDSGDEQKPDLVDEKRLENTYCGFCLFVSMARTSRSKKPYKLHVRYRGYEILYPLNEKSDFRLTESYFEKLRSAQDKLRRLRTHAVAGYPEEI